MAAILISYFIATGGGIDSSSGLPCIWRGSISLQESDLIPMSVCCGNHFDNWLSNCRWISMILYQFVRKSNSMFIFRCLRESLHKSILWFLSNLQPWLCEQTIVLLFTEHSGVHFDTCHNMWFLYLAQEQSNSAFETRRHHKKCLLWQQFHMNFHCVYIVRKKNVFILFVLILLFPNVFETSTQLLNWKYMFFFCVKILNIGEYFPTFCVIYYIYICERFINLILCNELWGTIFLWIYGMKCVQSTINVGKCLITLAVKEIADIHQSDFLFVKSVSSMWSSLRAHTHTQNEGPCPMPFILNDGMPIGSIWHLSLMKLLQ